ncbi:uncharacterized protein N7518_005516 [Penicillium psychrosexuale]|uniref:uncharacterized protein n=1 Tax=Penicillium psychrosexuale TaxID=1002107 RepID=UPI002545BC36|nr:uncharacterized protein N7518_005516 [Penicillium psychrosexuale]KAJ5796976.1 hypothetical protein N7518_005516 [Penicillium psychrosexuale]
MANQQKRTCRRRDSVTGSQMTGAPTPAIPLIASANPSRNGSIGAQVVPGPVSIATLSPTAMYRPSRNGPIGAEVVPGPSSATPSPIYRPSSTYRPSYFPQSPPHRTSPLVGPDTALQSPPGIRPPQKQPEASALEVLTDAEATIFRQENALNDARSQASALRSKMATDRNTTKLLDHEQMQAMIDQANSNRTSQIDCQFQVLEDDLEQVSVDLEHAEGKKKALQDCKKKLARDQADLHDLRQVVGAAGRNLQRQARLAGAEDRLKGLLDNADRMLAASMQSTRASQVQTRKATSAESSASPVGIARRHVVESQEPGSHGQAFDPHPQQLDKGKERGPRSLPLEDREYDDLSPDVLDSPSIPSLRPRIVPRSIRQGPRHANFRSRREDTRSLISQKPSRAGSHMDTATGQELAGMLQADESQVGDHNVVVQEAPATTATIAPQQVETVDISTDTTGQELAGMLQAEVCDEMVVVQEAPATTATLAPQQVETVNISTDATGQELAGMLQAEVCDEMVVVQEAPATTLTIAPQQVETNDMMELDDELFYSEVAKLNDESFDGHMEWDKEQTHVITLYNKDDLAAPSQSSGGHAAIAPPSLPLTRSLNRVIAQAVAAIPLKPGLPRVRDRFRVFKRRDRLVGSGRPRVHRRVDYLSVRRVLKRTADIFGSSEDGQPARKKQKLTHTAANVPEMSVPAVSQPAQSVHVQTEEVPTQAVMSVPAVSQPTQTTLESTESVEAEQVSTQAVMSEPAVSQPTQTVLEYTQTVSTEQVPTETAMSVPAVSQPTQVVLEATEQVPIDAILGEPAVSQPTQVESQEDETLETVQVPTEAVMSEPAVSQPTQAALESTVPESSVRESTTLESSVFTLSGEVVGAPAPSEPAPTESVQTEPSSVEEIPSVPAATKPTRNESDLTWQTEDELVVPSPRTVTRSHLDALLEARAARTQARPSIMSSPEGLQVTATSRVISTSSLVASPEDASVKNAVATGTDSRAGVSKGTKRVEDAENPNCSARQNAGEQREEMGGAAPSGLQMPGAWPSDPPAVTVSDESDMHEGSALLRGLWTGTRRLSFGVFAMVMVILLSFPLWAGHLGHLVYALEGPEQFLEELRWEHGYDVPIFDRIIYVLLRCFAGDRTLFG